VIKHGGTTYSAAVPPLRRAIGALRHHPGDGEEDTRWLWLACRVATDLWDDESWNELTTRQVRFARDSGALDVLPIALTYRAGVAVHAGDFAAAAAMIDEAEAISQATGNAPLRYTLLVLTAWRGDEKRALELIRNSREDATGRGEGRAITLAEYVTAVLYNGLGRYPAALAAAERAAGYDDLGLCGWADRAGRGGGTNRQPRRGHTRPATAQPACTGQPHRLGLRRGGPVTRPADRRASGRRTLPRGHRATHRTRIAVHLARSHLVYGEWLRREHRNLDAREPLRHAHDVFSRIGAAAFAERARHELLAT
jgi:tetratricopeptide (TPR) repeat protein